MLDPRVEITIGLAFFALGAWLMGGLNQYAGYWDIFWPRTCQGFALGFLFVPLTTTALSGIARGAMANATGIYTLVRQLGGSFAEPPVGSWSSRPSRFLAEMAPARTAKWVSSARCFANLPSRP
ncbi:MAG: hypothetical protein GIX03_13265 [Candidatus Eremiobacteraeota bacterium]|nr:hypothetical protein [Candidatus Eremiobacteraeota bacterium]MBC5822343.1 hypothetical protein [Candidatus Eremiobacteraeota bacterium]